MRRAVLLAGLLAACAPPPAPLTAFVEQSDDETLPWVSDLHGLARLHGRTVDLDLTLPPGPPEGGGTGVRQGGRELRCAAPGAPPPGEGDYAVTVPAVARVDLVLGAGAAPVCTQRYDGLGVRFRGRYRVTVAGDADAPRVRLQPVR